MPGFGQTPIYALFDRGTDREKIREIDLPYFLDLLFKGWDVTHRTPNQITLTLSVNDTVKLITVYIPSKTP